VDHIGATEDYAHLLATIREDMTAGDVDADRVRAVVIAAAPGWLDAGQPDPDRALDRVYDAVDAVGRCRRGTALIRASRPRPALI
jgi:hypothetical protein